MLIELGSNKIIGELRFINLITNIKVISVCSRKKSCILKVKRYNMSKGNSHKCTNETGEHGSQFKLTSKSTTSIEVSLLLIDISIHQISPMFMILLIIQDHICQEDHL